MQFGCAGCDEMPSVQAQESPQFQLAAKARYQRNMTDGVKFPYLLRRSPDRPLRICKETPCVSTLQYIQSSLRYIANDNQRLYVKMASTS